MNDDNCIINNNLIILKYNFNQPLGNSLSNLTNLTFLSLGYNFNQLLDLPLNIEILSLNCDNLYLIENLPNSVKELYLGYNFNLKLNNLPSSIEGIIFHEKSKYNQELNNLPKLLELLKLPEKYKLDIKNINPSCKIIRKK